MTQSRSTTPAHIHAGLARLRPSCLHVPPSLSASSPSCLRASVPSCLHSPSSLRRSVAPSLSAFTLVELLVVIGIIAILAGLILVGVTRSQAHARSARALADLQAIATALEVYKSDLGDYPPSAGTGISRGELLAWALVGPYNQATDGKDGPGFRCQRIRNADGTYTYRGSVYGPYLDPEKFLLPSGSSYFLKDGFGQPILYFRRVANPGNNTDPSTFYTAADNAGVNAANTQPLNRSGATAQDRFNAIAGREKATGPYLLWSAGADAAFGPEDPANADQVKSCDDVLLSGSR